MRKEIILGLLVLILFWGLSFSFQRFKVFETSIPPMIAWTRVGPFTIQEKLLFGFPLSLNQLSAKDWEVLPKVGPKLAQNIVDYRKQKGGFQNVEDLLNVKGMGPKILEKLRPFLIP